MNHYTITNIVSPYPFVFLLNCIWSCDGQAMVCTRQDSLSAVYFINNTHLLPWIWTCCCKHMHINSFVEAAAASESPLWGKKPSGARKHNSFLSKVMACGQTTCKILKPSEHPLVVLDCLRRNQIEIHWVTPVKVILRSVCAVISHGLSESEWTREVLWL